MVKPPRLYTYRYQSTGVDTEPDYYCLNVVRSSLPRVGVGVPILPTLPTLPSFPGQSLQLANPGKGRAFA